MAGVRRCAHLTLWFLRNEMPDRERRRSFKEWKSSLRIGGWVFLLDIAVAAACLLLLPIVILLYGAPRIIHPLWWWTFGLFLFWGRWWRMLSLKFVGTCFLGWIPSIEISGSYSKYTFKLKKNYQTIFQSLAVQFYISISKVRKFQFLHILTNTWYC